MVEPKVIEIPEEYQKLFDNNWREAAIYGGRYSLKSHTVARFLLIRARQEKTRVACFREFQNSIAESSHQLLSDIINQYGLTDFEITDKNIVNKINGSDFIFKGLWHNEQSIKSIEGIDIAWVEEAQTVSKKSLEVLTPTVRKKGSKIVYTYNRLLEDDPVHQRLVIEGRPDTIIINVNYDIALKYGWMPDEIKKEIEDDQSFRPALYKHKWLGEPNSSERKIFKDWKIIDEIPHQAHLERYGLDYGYTNDPTAIVAVYSFQGEYIIDEIVVRKGVKAEVIAELILNQGREALTVADSVDPEQTDEIKKRGVPIVPVLKTKSGSKNFVSWSIELVQSQRVSVTKNSVNVIQAYNNYFWEVDRDEKILNIPCHDYSDPMDAIRYALVSILKKPTIMEFKPSAPILPYYGDVDCNF